MRLSRLVTELLRYILAAGLMIAVTLGLNAVRGVLDTPVVALLLLLPVGFSTAIWGLGPGITAALCAFLGFNYFFISPYYTFSVHRPEDVVVLLVFLVVAVVVSQLVARAQAGMAAATAREQEATQLYELSTALAGKQDDEDVIRTLGLRILSSFEGEAVEIELSEPPARVICLPEIPAGAPPRGRPADVIVPIQGLTGALG